MLHELYISVDIESSGPIPGEYSLLSIGACVVENPSSTFYAELKPLNNNYLPKAMEVNGLSLEKLQKEGEPPTSAMSRFETWISGLLGGGATPSGGDDSPEVAASFVAGKIKPVFLAFNATFDWSFTHWYFIKFLGRDPFGISGLDIKAYFMGQHHVRWQETTKKHVKKIYPPNQTHTHNALDDALEQAQIFSQMFHSS